MSRDNGESLRRTDLIISNVNLEKLGSKKAGAKPEKGDSKPTDSPKKFKIVLSGAGNNKTLVIKGVMKITNLDLKSVGELIKELPIELASGLTEAEANDWRSKFEKSGAKVTVEKAY